MVKGTKCAAVILNYNDAENAVKFASEINQFAMLDHIIIIDNGSSDDSWKTLSSIRLEKVIVDHTDHNGGYGFGNNYGVHLAKEQYNCDIVFICNSDIQVDEMCMYKMAETIIENKDVAVCAPVQINGFNKAVIDKIAWKLPTTYDYVRSSFFFMNHILPHRRYQYDSDCIEVDCVPGAFLAVESNKFISCGGYDEGIFLYCEESVLGARLKKENYKTCLLMDKQYLHYHSTSIKKSYPKEIYRFKLMLNSRKYYLVHYRNIQGLKLAFVNAMFSLAIIEQRIKLMIAGIVNYRE